MKIIEHCYKRYFYRTYIIKHYWIFTIEYNGVRYNGEIEYNCYSSNMIDENTDFDGYFIGYLMNSEIKVRYENSYISFGYSDVRNKVRYILEDMKKVIDGNFSNVVDSGSYKHDILNLK